MARPTRLERVPFRSARRSAGRRSHEKTVGCGLGASPGSGRTARLGPRSAQSPPHPGRRRIAASSRRSVMYAKQTEGSLRIRALGRARLATRDRERDPPRPLRRADRLRAPTPQPFTLVSSEPQRQNPQVRLASLLLAGPAASALASTGPISRAPLSPRKTTFVELGSAPTPTRTQHLPPTTRHRRVSSPAPTHYSSPGRRTFPPPRASD